MPLGTMASDYAWRNWTDDRNSQVLSTSSYSPPTYSIPTDANRNSFYSRSSRLNSAAPIINSSRIRLDGSLHSDRKIILFDKEKDTQVSGTKDTQYTPVGFLDITIEDIYDLPVAGGDIGWISGSALCNPMVECQHGTIILRTNTWQNKVSVAVNTTFRFRAEDSDVTIRIKHTSALGALFGASELVGEVTIRKEDWRPLTEASLFRRSLLVAGESGERIGTLRDAEPGQTVLGTSYTESSLGLCVRFGGGNVIAPAPPPAAAGPAAAAAPQLDTDSFVAELDAR